jgi:hypothetical protein
MSIPLAHPPRKMSETLEELAATLPHESLDVRFLLERVGQEGLLAVCLFLALPFLIPVSIPGVSTVFGLLIVLISIGVILNSVPWLPRRLLDRPVSREQLAPLLERGAKMFVRAEKLLRPRLLFLSAGTLMHRLNGFGLLAAGLLLMAPFGFVPFSNTLPGLAVMLLAAGLLQRDGWFILAGYVMILATAVYFTVLIVGAVWGGTELFSLLSGG